MVTLRYAGSQLTLKKQKTFKELSQSGLLITTETCQFLCNEKQVSMAEIMRMRERPFKDHVDGCRKMGFELHIKRAKVGNSKHVRVRPMFRNWSVIGEISVLKNEITDEILTQMFTLAGRAGLGDWRPSGKTPGPYGQFAANVTPIL